MKTDLTIVIPTIGRDTLDRSIQSILAQTVETPFIVTPDVNEIGIGANLNRILPVIDTEYVGFVADDDRLDIDYHKWFLEENENSDLFMFQMIYPLDWHAGRVLPDSADINNWGHGNVGGSYIIKTARLREFLFEENKEINEDWDIIGRMREAGLKLQLSGHVAYYIRQ